MLVSTNRYKVADDPQKRPGLVRVPLNLPEERKYGVKPESALALNDSIPFSVGWDAYF